MTVFDRLRTDASSVESSGTARILVLDADGRVGLACTQSLGAHGHLVHVGVRKRASAVERSRYALKVHPQPPGEPVDRAVDWLTELDARYAFTLVIASTEASLRWLRAMPEDHPVRRKAVLPSNASLDLALDKAATARIARELALPMPPSREIAGPEDIDGIDGVDGAVSDYPRVLKPVRSKVVIGTRLTSLSVVHVHDDAARAATLASLLPFTPVQEQGWIPGRGVGVEALYVNGRMAWHFVHERVHEWPLTGGASTLRRAGQPDDPLVEMTRRLLDRLQWHGVAMVEWRRAADGRAWLVEINPRLWGSLPLTIAAGVDMPAGLLALARGEPLPAARPWRVGLTARAMSDDFRWCFENLRADRSDRLLLTESPWRMARGWLRPLAGREVWDGWVWRDFAVARAELAGLLRERVGALFGRLGRHAAERRARAQHAGMLRDGPLSQPVGSVLFMCLGNLCRSPFAAAVARDRMPDVQVESAGFLHHDGRSSPPHIVSAARALGLDVSDSRARRVTARHIEAADLVVVMDLQHLELMAHEFPEALPKTTLLGLFAAAGPTEISDPYDFGPAATRVVFDQIVRAVEAFAAQQSPTVRARSTTGATSTNGATAATGAPEHPPAVDDAPAPIGTR